MDFLYDEDANEEEEEDAPPVVESPLEGLFGASANTEAAGNLTNQFFEKGGFKFLSELEQNYTDCSSVCDVPLFFISHNILEGMP